MTKTANKMPQVRKSFLDRSCIVDRTSALMMALSMLLMVSKRQSPPMTRRIVKASMGFVGFVWGYKAF